MKPNNRIAPILPGMTPKVNDIEPGPNVSMQDCSIVSKNEYDIKKVDDDECEPRVDDVETEQQE